ncbi:hypothetical protein HanIR_Chr11g0511371 [Helianthus annuus]|nr:hypothetical protein HanIR_Chr11g0511371 [Helianthus annuus]
MFISVGNVFIKLRYRSCKTSNDYTNKLKIFTLKKFNRISIQLDFQETLTTITRSPVSTTFTKAQSRVSYPTTSRLLHVVSWLHMLLETMSQLLI